MTFDELLMISIPWVMVGSFLAAVGHAIGATIGESDEGLVGLWWRTRALHPIAVGMVLGLSDLPIPEAMGEGLLARLIWYGTAGGLAVPIYELVKRSLDRRAR